MSLVMHFLDHIFSISSRPSDDGDAYPQAMIRLLASAT